MLRSKPEASLEAISTSRRSRRLNRRTPCGLNNERSESQPSTSTFNLHKRFFPNHFVSGISSSSQPLCWWVPFAERQMAARGQKNLAMQLNPIVRFVGLLALAWCCGRCANPVPPTGGPRDEQPPRLDTLRSTPNYQTHFRKQPIELTFDEWIRLNDPLNQIVVSPPLQYRPEVKLRKKTVVFRFDEREVLKDNATYTIHFGEAIQDLTEGNVATVRFLFSTGPFIDSLVVTGRVVDAFTGAPAEGVRFMLYDNLADSVVHTERPFYFGTTDAGGRVRIENVRADTFRVVALADANRNYFFDAGEHIAFPDTFVVVRDSLTEVPVLRLFAEELPLRLLDEEEPHYGLLRLWFNREPWDARLWWDRTAVQGWPEPVGDSIYFWYAGAEAPFRVVVLLPDGPDTVQAQAAHRPRLAEVSPLRAVGRRPAVMALPPAQPFRMEWNHPLAALDTARVLLLADTTRTPRRLQYRFEGAARRTLALEPEGGWREGATCELVLLPGALTDVWGLTQKDTLRQSLRIRPRSEFGALTLTVAPLDTAMHYVLQLWQGEDRLVDTHTIHADSTWTHRWPLLEPGTWRAILIEDRNADGRYTPGHYALRRQPERVLIRPLEEVRANWEVEAVMRVEW